MRLRQYLPALFLLSALGANAAPPSTEPGVEVYAARRAKLMAQLPKGAVAILNAAPQLGDNTAYRPESNFWYITGMPELGAIALIRPDAADGKRYTLFSKPKKWEEELWTGYRVGQDAAPRRYGADAAFSNADFSKQLRDIMADATSLWLLDGGDAAFRDKVMGAWNARAANSGVALPVYNLTTTLAAMRLIKDPTEVALLREAVDLSVQAHLAALPLAQAGKGEWQLRGAMINVCNAGNAARMAYPSIVGSGANAVVLHYDADDQLMKQGDMIVNDSACEYGMYAADVTRSYPVGGVFSPQQKAVYEIVLRASKAGQAKAVVGAEFQAVMDATVDVIVDGLLELGIMKGSKAAIIADKSYKAFYPHGSSHWIGLDVHDAGSYERNHVPSTIAEPMRRYYAVSHVTFKPGMAFTIEPGIYIPAGSKDVDPKWFNIGVRIEDDFLVTDKGSECLSCALPRDVASIEKLMRKH